MPSHSSNQSNQDQAISSWQVDTTYAPTQNIAFVVYSCAKHSPHKKKNLATNCHPSQWAKSAKQFLSKIMGGVCQTCPSQPVLGQSNAAKNIFHTTHSFAGWYNQLPPARGKNSCSSTHPRPKVHLEMILIKTSNFYHAQGGTPQWCSLVYKPDEL